MSNTERAPLAMTRALTIPPRFCGPSGIGNVGYVCGRIAAYVDGQATVTLRRPPLLATPMAVGQLAAYGTGDQVRAQLGLWDDAADIVTILLPPGLPWDTIEATLRAAAPAR